MANTTYLCLNCLQYAPCKCFKAKKPTPTKWTRKKVYEIQLTEVINYSGDKDEDGEFESEDRGDCDFYSLEDWRLAKEAISSFEPYHDGNGHVFKLTIDINVFYHHFRNGEFHHDEKIDDIEPEHAPKKVRSIIDKIR